MSNMEPTNKQDEKQPNTSASEMNKTPTENRVEKREITSKPETTEPKHNSEENHTSEGEKRDKPQNRNRNYKGRHYGNRNWRNKKKTNPQLSANTNKEEKTENEVEKPAPQIKETSENNERSVKKSTPNHTKIKAEVKGNNSELKPKWNGKQSGPKVTKQDNPDKSVAKVSETKVQQQKNTDKPATQKKTPTHIPPKKNNRNKPGAKKQIKKAIPLVKKDGRSFPGIKKVSIVIPLLNEEESLRVLYNDIRKAISPYSFDYEILFIDDGSTDNSLNILRDLSRRDNKVHYFSFRKNHGKSAALNIGFTNAKGDAIITMDADLQDDPAEIPNLLKKLSEGYDLVSGWKKVRHDPFIKRHSSKFFNYMTRLSSDVKIHDFNCGLKAYRKEVVKSVYVHGELHRYIPVLAGQKGFKITEIPVKHHPRRYGKTKYGISRFFKGFVDLLTILLITRYATRPLHLFGFIGTIAFIGGFAIDGYLTLEWMLHKTSLSNRPLLLLGLLMMIVGVQLFAIGLLGELFVHRFRSDIDFSIKESK